MHAASQKLRISLSLLTTSIILWQLWLFLTGSKTAQANYWFNAAYATIFLSGALLGLIAHRKRYIQGALGRTLTFFSLGSLSFSFALFIWAYEGIVNNTSAPFPSSADIFFILYAICIGAGCIAILQLLGPLLKKKAIYQTSGFIFLVFIGLLVTLILPSIAQETNWVTVLLTIIYPTIACILLCLAIIAVRSSGGTTAKSLKLFFLSLIFLSAALVTFLIRHNTGSYWNGDISDFFCIIAGYTAALACIEVGWGEIV